MNLRAFGETFVTLFVITGVIAERPPWRSTTRRSPRPLARAVRM